MTLDSAAGGREEEEIGGVKAGMDGRLTDVQECSGCHGKI